MEPRCVSGDSIHECAELFLSNEKPEELLVSEPAGEVAVKVINTLKTVHEANVSIPETTILIQPQAAESILSNLYPSARASDLSEKGLLDLKYVERQQGDQTGSQVEIAEQSLVTEDSKWLILPSEDKIVRIEKEREQSAHQIVDEISPLRPVELRTATASEIEESLSETIGEVAAQKMEDSMARTGVIRSSTKSINSRDIEAAVAYVLLSAEEGVKMNDIVKEVTDNLELATPMELEDILSILHSANVISIPRNSPIQEKSIRKGESADMSVEGVSSFALRVADSLHT